VAVQKKQYPLSVCSQFARSLTVGQFYTGFPPAVEITYVTRVVGNEVREAGQRPPLRTSFLITPSHTTFFLAEEKRMVYQVIQSPGEVAAMEKLFREFTAELNNLDQLEDQVRIRFLLQEAEQLLCRIDARRKLAPNSIPQMFVLVRQPHHKTFGYEELMRRGSVLTEDSGSNGGTKFWPYLDWRCSPTRHIRPVMYGAERSAVGTFALFVEDKDSYPITTSRLEKQAGRLCYDWICPVDWYVSLANFETIAGPYKDKHAADIFSDHDVICVGEKGYYSRWRNAGIPGGGLRFVHVQWCMHLVPPFALDKRPLAG